MTAARSRALAHLGRAVRTARTSLRITQAPAARRTGLHRNYLGAIERGEINPTYETLLKLAAGLGVPLDDLIKNAAALPTKPHRRRPFAEGKL